jgi:hypothetical protein
VQFDPPLPPFKQNSINALAMGTENRVAMLFPKVFWDKEAHFLRPMKGRYTFSNNHALGISNILCAWIRPDAVDALEAMTPEEAMADVEKVHSLNGFRVILCAWIRPDAVDALEAMTPEEAMADVEKVHSLRVQGSGLKGSGLISKMVPIR